ncbi:conserved phage C-terminal domain-containing protein [uncultured Anaerococcus sp.]|uniref:conserved phage C-terminal domain-containing protein n=1 Tax=uncultured Anaerococcus sp. TaxID=293428 RepID=UPI00288A0910|nr:conserved phage C-terminal domain-containing protein [uncultured Anaerococcus sp.]
MYDDKQKSNTKNEEIEEINKPSYYTVMPAVVRYDDRLKANEKILYSEIVTLASKNGYCYANNRYFANLYKVDKYTVSKWIANLKKFEYIDTDIVYKNDYRTVEERRIFLILNEEITNTGIDEIVDTIDEKDNTLSDNPPIPYGLNHQLPMDEITNDNITSINKTSINKRYCRVDGKNEEIIISVINYLNEKADKNYKSTTQKTKSLINARIKEGFTLDDFKKVIDTKTQQWKLSVDMNRYLRPETLFGNKFESYLQEKNIDNRASNNASNRFADEDKNVIKI